MFEAVIWDFGGVITTSPFEAFNRFEAERGLPRDLIRGINATNPDTNAWARFERAVISAEEFDAAFAAEAAERGYAVRGRDVLPLLSGDLRPAMVTALTRCSARLKTGCITNNVKAGSGAGMARSADKARAMADVMGLFRVVLESSKIGIRKPDPRIYQMMCEALAVSPARAVYLDDLGVNLKPARALGMTTIKVEDPARALGELEAAVGFPVT